MLLLDTESIITGPRKNSVDSANSVDRARFTGSTVGTDYLGSSGYILIIHNRPVVMVSPLDIQTYILQIPVLNQKRREETIRLQLRSHYPGDAASAEIDYFLFAKQKDESSVSCHRAVVFLKEHSAEACFPTRSLDLSSPSDKLTGAESRNKEIPLIPGIAVMLAAIDKLGHETIKGSNTAGMNHTGNSETAVKYAIIMIVTPDWIEAAGFENGEVTGHAAVKRTAVYLPSPLFEAVCPEQDLSKISALIILKDIPAADSYVSAICGQFKESKVINIGDIIQEINIKRSAIFKYHDKQREVNSKRIIKSMIILQALSLLITLCVLTARAEDYRAALEQTYRAQTRYHEEADKLLAEIAELENRKAPPNEGTPRFPNPYSLISEIRTRLPDVLVHSIVIQEDRFNFEAEGADSIRSLNALRASGYFSSLILHQTIPSKRGGEQFSISGSIRNE
jgi:hypothetical protein